MARVANISFRADISNLTKQLKEMPNVTGAEAKRMVAELKKELAKAAKAAKATTAEMAKGAKAAGKAGKAGADGMEELGKQSGQAKEAAAQLGAAVSVVNPELGRMVSQAGALTGALQGVSKAGGMVGASLPIVAAVVVALGLAVAAYAQQAKVAHQESRELGGAIDGVSLSMEHMEAMQEAGTRALDGFRESIRTAALEVAVLRGEMTELERAEQEAARAAALSIKPGMDAAAQSITAAQKEITNLEAKMKRFQKTQYDVDIYIADPTEELEAARARLAASEEHLESLRDERIAGQEVIATALQLKDAQKRGAEAGKKRASAEKESAKDEAAQIKALGTAEAILASIRGKSTADLLSDEEKIIQARDAELLMIREAAMLTGARAEAAEAMAEVEARAERDLARLREANLKEYDAKREQSHRDELQRIQTQAANLSGASSQFFSGLASLAQWAAEKQGEAQADAAERWFKFYKASSILQIVIDGAAAAVKAVAQLGPIAGGIAAGGIAALTAAQSAVVAGQELPSYHVGGMAPDETMAVLRRNEPVLTAQAGRALGEHGVNALNRGQSPMGGQLVIQQVYRHRVFGEVVRDNYRLPGSPLRAAIKGGSRVGHRAA